MDFIFLLLFSCEEDKLVTGNPAVFEISEEQIPQQINSNSAEKVLFSAKVVHPEGEAGIVAVNLLLVANSGNENRFRMYDDGSVNHASGDVIAFDGVYSVLVGGNNSGLRDGFYAASIEAVSAGDEIIHSAEKSLRVLQNIRPVVEAVSFPDSISAGMQPLEITATVSDSNGVDDVRWVLVDGQHDFGLQKGFRDTLVSRPGGSAVFSRIVDSSYATGKMGNYLLQFVAEDMSEEKSIPLSRSVYFENTPPQVWDTVVPDSLKVPQSGAAEVLITVRVKDRQSLSDIQEVYFDSVKPDGNPSSGNPFYMYDNGLPYNQNEATAVGDKIAGDGVYSLTIFLPPGTPLGVYTFTFYAKDKAGQLTPGPADSIRVIQ